MKMQIRLRFNNIKPLRKVKKYNEMQKLDCVNAFDQNIKVNQTS